MVNKPKCQKGKPCGNSCIRVNAVCRVGLGAKQSSQLTSLAATLTSKRGKGQSLDGENLNFAVLRQRAKDWAISLGLDPDDITPGHDEVHVLTRDYVGKSGSALGALLGEKSKGGPTNFEEALVEVFELVSRFPGQDPKPFFPDSIMETYQLSKNLGVLPKDHMYNLNMDRALRRTEKYLEALTSRPDFGQFMTTVRTARKLAREEFRKG
jgi:hypothetical protein